MNLKENKKTMENAFEGRKGREKCIIIISKIIKIVFK